MELEGASRTPLGLVQWKRASCRVEAGTSGFVSISNSDRRVPAELGQESHASSCKEEWNYACLSSYSRGDRELFELCLESAGFSRRCTRVSVPLRVVPSSTGLPFKRCPGIGFLSRADRITAQKVIPQSVFLQGCFLPQRLRMPDQLVVIWQRQDNCPLCLPP